MLPPDLVAALAPGTVISGKYRVERPLGTGGMGVVVAARHLELNQTFAIKVLLPNAANSSEAITRFLREGRSAAQVTSPHVAKIHDTGRLPSGAPYLVMELLRGRDLRAHLAEVGRVPLAQAIEWILQAAHALAEAHALTIIHRDVKPANLFLADTTAGQQIKVLDFGISKQLDSGDAALTNTASAVGTPRYMAPEQMRSARFADGRGDVWSLGIVLYELATGRYPFHGETITALCFDIMERTPAPPSEVNPDLPASFDEIVARCLEKDPSDRFQSMEALATALSSIAPGSRSSGLFNGASLQPAGPVSGTTPVSTPSAPNTAPMAPGFFPELPPQETMRTWDTTAVSRPVAKKTQHVPLIALGVGIGIAAATLVGTLVDGRASTPPSVARSGALTLRFAVSPPITPAITVVAVPDPPEPPASPASVSEPLPPTPTPQAPPPQTTTPQAKPQRSRCKPPFTVDEKGHRIPKPECLK